MDNKDQSLPRMRISSDRAAEIQAILEHYDEWQSTNPHALKNLHGRISQFPINQQQPLLDRMKDILQEQKKRTFQTS